MILLAFKGFYDYLSLMEIVFRFQIQISIKDGLSLGNCSSALQLCLNVFHVCFKCG